MLTIYSTPTAAHCTNLGHVPPFSPLSMGVTQIFTSPEFSSATPGGANGLSILWMSICYRAWFGRGSSLQQSRHRSRQTRASAWFETSAFLNLLRLNSPPLRRYACALPC